MEEITQSSKLKTQNICMLTAYDYPIAKILDEAGVDIVLVGDSLGNVVLGYKNTRSVTIDDMVHHTGAVARGVKRALLVADIPFKALSLLNAKKLISAGAEAVKIEGIKGIRQIKRIIKAGIPVMGHLGHLPQTMPKAKVHHDKGLIKQAKMLEKAGVFALVLEMVDKDLTKEITLSLNIPTIGIGSGNACNGQVLVTYDLIGLSDWSPKFAPKYADIKKSIKGAVKKFIGRP